MFVCTRQQAGSPIAVLVFIRMIVEGADGAEGTTRVAQKTIQSLVPFTQICLYSMRSRADGWINIVPPPHFGPILLCRLSTVTDLYTILFSIDAHLLPLLVDAISAIRGNVVVRFVHSSACVSSAMERFFFSFFFSAILPQRSATVLKRVIKLYRIAVVKILYVTAGLYSIVE